METRNPHFTFRDRARDRTFPGVLEKGLGIRSTPRTNAHPRHQARTPTWTTRIPSPAALQRSQDSRRQDVAQIRARLMRSIRLIASNPRSKRCARPVVRILHDLTRRQHAQPRILLVVLRRMQHAHGAQKFVPRTHHMTRWFEQRDGIVVRVPHAPASIDRKLLVVVQQHATIGKKIDDRRRHDPSRAGNLERRASTRPIRGRRSSTPQKSGETNRRKDESAKHRSSG